MPKSVPSVRKPTWVPDKPQQVRGFLESFYVHICALLHLPEGVLAYFVEHVVPDRVDR